MKNAPPETDKKELKIDLDARFNKIKKDIAAENEVTVSVTWTGGGQNLKEEGQDWDFDTMKAVALRFPDLCAKTPMRTHALLTKYTALRSFYTNQTFDLPAYDKTGTYTNILQEAYLDYKSILGAIQVLAWEASEGTKALIPNPRAAKAGKLPPTSEVENDAELIQVEQAKTATTKGEEDGKKPANETPSATDAESVDGSVVDVTTVAKLPPKVITLPPPAIDEPFPPTIEGLEVARLKCRYMMNRIVQEVR